MNIHEFRNTSIRVSYAIKTQRTYNALETHMKREFAGQICGRKCNRYGPYNLEIVKPYTCKY